MFDGIAERRKTVSERDFVYEISYFSLLFLFNLSLLNDLINKR